MIRDKKKMRELIALLQPSTLAAFLPWGSSKGASRASLTSRKNNNSFDLLAVWRIFS